MKKLLFLLIITMAFSTFGQTILSENFGTPTATTAIATYTGYQEEMIILVIQLLPINTYKLTV